MEGTRGRIVELLRERGDATIDELTAQLGLAYATVRRHLDVLQRDRVVELHPVRHGTGRPHYVFTLTQAGHDLQPARYVGITGFLLSELLALTPADTYGRSGREIALLVFERMAESLQAACEPRVTAPSLPERLQQTVEALSEGGLMLEAQPQLRGYRIMVRDCPCRCAGSAQEAVCSRSEQMLAHLLRSEVHREQVTEPRVCAYVVSES